MNNEIIYAYEQTLLGHNKFFSSKNFLDEFNKKDGTINQKEIIDIFKYIFENLLHWTPSDVYNCINIKLLELLKLNTLLEYIEFPVELDKEKDLFYIACLMYPNIYSINENALCIHAYKKVLDSLKDGVEEYKLPKGFFNSEEGELRSIICFRYALSYYGITFKNAEEYYEYFANPKINTFLRKIRLKNACDLHFKNVLEFAHRSLSPQDRNNLFYLANQFFITVKTIEKKK